MLNIDRIEFEEQLKDMHASLVKAQQDRQQSLLKLFLTTDAEECYWRRVAHWDACMYVTRLRADIASLEKYLKETPAHYLITKGVTFG